MPQKKNESNTKHKFVCRLKKSKDKNVRNDKHLQVIHHFGTAVGWLDAVACLIENKPASSALVLIYGSETTPCANSCLALPKLAPVLR